MEPSKEYLDRQKTKLEIGELRRAPWRTSLLSIATTIATISTSVAVAALTYQVSLATMLQHESEDYIQLIRSLADSNSSARAGAAIGLARYIDHPPRRPAFLPNSPDRADQTFTMLASRLSDENDGVVLTSIVQTLRASDVSTQSAVDQITQLDRNARQKFYAVSIRALRADDSKTPIVSDDFLENVRGIRDDWLLRVSTNGLKSMAISETEAASEADDLHRNVQVASVDLDANGTRYADIPAGIADATLVHAVYAAARRLAAANLALADLFGRLRRIRPFELDQADLVGVKFDSLDLSDYHLEGAAIVGSARHASFRCAPLHGSDLSFLDVSDADFYGADLAEASLPSGVSDVDLTALTPSRTYRNSNWYDSATAKSPALGAVFSETLHEQRMRARADYAAAQKRCSARAKTS